MLTSYLLPGVDVSDFFSALFFAALLALLNATVKPLLIIFTLPLTVFTLGLFLLVINAVVILMADDFIPGVEVDGSLVGGPQMNRSPTSHHWSLICWV